MNYYNPNERVQLTNYESKNSKLTKYELHPTSIKLLGQGNPWVTLDEFSERFHPKDRFIVALNRRKPFALLLHDPRHPQVRARLWSKDGNFERQIKNFKNDLIKRLHDSIKQRFDQKISNDRNNFYLVFGEADKLPGLFIQRLNDQYLIQYYAYFWDRYEDTVINSLIKKIEEIYSIEITRSEVWVQNRTSGLDYKAPAKSLDPITDFRSTTVREFGVDYKVTLGKFYDHGIYTDMSSVRAKVIEQMKGAKSVLNLYSYTGAFSLFALKNGAERVVSVDLSEQYLDWLKENIELNKFEQEYNHEAICDATSTALDDLASKEEKFDFVICDPPTSSSDGTKRTNALRDYEKNLVKIDKVLSENGKALIFLNTHKVNRRKFESKVCEILVNKKIKLKTTSLYGLSQDCPFLAKFPEGSYLKGILLERGEPKLKLNKPFKKKGKKFTKKANDKN